MTTYTPNFVVQDDFGGVANANAYITLDFFRQYWTDRGVDVTADPYSSDTKCQAAIIQGTIYMDYRWQYYGMRCQITQNTEWPRYSVIDNDRNPVDGITPPLMKACAEYANIALITGPLNPTPSRDDTGQALQAKTTQVGPIMTSKRYIGGGSFMQPIYPVPDGILKREGYIFGGSQLVRG
jgi:DnaT-like ssDNA binding protein